MSVHSDLDPQSPRRIATPEWMDSEAVDDVALRKALRFIRRVNQLLGYNHLLGTTFYDLVKDLPDDRPLVVLDVATGSADIATHLDFWSSRSRKPARFIGLDLHAGTLAEAKRYTRAEVPLVRGDALTLPFADNSVDVAITSMFLHHLPNEQAAAVLREMNRVARVGIIAADLIRDRRAYRWINVLTFFSSRMIKHDARVSVQQAFSLREVARLRRAAGLDYARARSGANYRFIISGRKSGSLSRVLTGEG